MSIPKLAEVIGRIAAERPTPMADGRISGDGDPFASYTSAEPQTSRPGPGFARAGERYGGNT